MRNGTEKEGDEVHYRGCNGSLSRPSTLCRNNISTLSKNMTCVPLILVADSMKKVTELEPKGTLRMIEKAIRQNDMEEL